MLIIILLRLGSIFHDYLSIAILKKEAVKIVTFQLRVSHTSSLLNQNSILKFQDKSFSKIFHLSANL